MASGNSSKTFAILHKNPGAEPGFSFVGRAPDLNGNRCVTIVA
jgi:hypothetical protein